MDNKAGQNDKPLLFFETPGELRNWLEINHAVSSGIWLRFYKKKSGVPSLNYDQALDEALCFGWIDGQLKKYDDQSYIQKFTPRRARSLWSKRNIGNVIRLEQAGMIRPSGMKEIEAAKADGRWENSYDSASTMSIPEDLIEELSKDPETAEFFNNLDRVNKYAITWRLQTSRNKEMREKRLKVIVEMLSKRKKFH